MSKIAEIVNYSEKDKRILQELKVTGFAIQSDNLFPTQL